MRRFIAVILSLMLLACCCAAGAEEYQVGDVVTYGHYEQDNDLNNAASAKMAEGHGFEIEREYAVYILKNQA